MADQAYRVKRYSDGSLKNEISRVLFYFLKIVCVMPKFWYAEDQTKSDTMLSLAPWSLVVLKDKIMVLGPGLGLEGQVLVNSVVSK